MNKISLLIILLFSVCAHSLANAQMRSMSDGKRRIYYSDVKDAEKKLLEYFKEQKAENTNEDNSNNFPYEMFKDLVLHDERTFLYDFNLEHIDELYSDNKVIKIYSWDTGYGGTVNQLIYDGVFSYKIGVKYYAFSPTYEDEYYTNVKENSINNIVPLWLKPKKIYSIKKDNSSITFYVEFWYRTYGSIQSIKAYSICDNGIISEAYIFENENGKFVSEIEHSALPGWSIYEDWMKNDVFTIIKPIMFQPKETKGFCLPHSSGKKHQWIFNGDIFQYIGIDFDADEKICERLRNYSANIVTVNFNSWIVRIDLMPDGEYRYSSWKNKNISEEPDLVLYNGIRLSPTEGNKGFLSLKEEFIFINGNYKYILSYEMVAYNSFYECASPVLIVKQHNKELMKLTTLSIIH